MKELYTERWKYRYIEKVIFMSNRKTLYKGMSQENKVKSILFALSCLSLFVYL